MKKIVVTGLSIILLCILFASPARSQQKVKIKVSVKENEGRSNFGGNHVPGTWAAYVENEKVNILFTGEDWETGRSFLLAELGALPGTDEGTFKLTRDAGTITFKGVFAGGKGHGFYSFAENPAFKVYLAQVGYTGLDKELMLNLFFTDINKKYFTFLKSNGYAVISNRQLKDIAEQDLNRKVMSDYFGLFETESWGHPTLDKIIELREHGVNGRFVNSFHQMGYKANIPLEKAMDLRDHGVSPEFITSIQKMGYGNISLDEAVDLRDHGVNPEFIYSIQQMGFKDITLEKARELRDHGVNPEFIKSICALGFKDVSLEKAQELRDHGVSAEYIKKMKTKGLNVHTLDDYIRLRDNGFNE